jgi:hypothetical protein
MGNSHEGNLVAEEELPDALETGECIGTTIEISVGRAAQGSDY